MNIPEMKSIVKENIKPYEDLLARRGFLFKEDEQQRYELLRWFESILATNKKEDVVNHIRWFQENGLKVYDHIAQHAFKE